MRPVTLRDETEASRLEELDVLLRQLSDLARLLPALTAHNAAEERRRLVECVRNGRRAVPRWRHTRRELPPEVWKSLDRARELACATPAPELYQARLDELELELSMIAALGEARRVRPLAARRFGTGAMRVPTRAIDPEGDGEISLAEVAEVLLDVVPDDVEPRVLPPTASQGPSFAAVIRALAAEAGLEVEVLVEPRLAAAAASGERNVLIADRRFGRGEAWRLAVHEVLGHLVAAANGRAQPLRLLEVGTAGSFADQEGVAIALEERAGLLDGHRLRTLAARVLATDRMHAGETFEQTCRALLHDHGFAAEEAVALTERAHRGGGVARDVSYLAGWLRVRAALRREETTVDELRAGRVSLDALPALRALAADCWVEPPVCQPSLERSLRATCSGTSFDAFPPSAVTSFTRFEAT